MPIRIFPPDQSADASTDGVSPSWRSQEPKQTLGHLMGEWNVVWSTLPLWKVSVRPENQSRGRNLMIWDVNTRTRKVRESGRQSRQRNADSSASP